MSNDIHGLTCMYDYLGSNSKNEDDGQRVERTLACPMSPSPLCHKKGFGYQEWRYTVYRSSTTCLATHISEEGRLGIENSGDRQSCIYAAEEHGIWHKWRPSGVISSFGVRASTSTSDATARWMLAASGGSSACESASSMLAPMRSGMTLSCNASSCSDRRSIF